MGTVPWRVDSKQRAMGSSVAEPCNSDTVPAPVKVLTSYFPSFSSGSGSLHTLKKFKKIKFLILRFLLKLYGNRLILT